VDRSGYIKAASSLDNPVENETVFTEIAVNNEHMSSFVQMNF